VAPKGLAASRHANGNGTSEDATETAGKDSSATDGKSEPDHSSAALAIV
jgi:hypothetical protein